MRVNMDSSIAFDPRFKMMAKILGIHPLHVVGCCWSVWLHCYQSRSERLSGAEANASADIDGFIEAMVQAGLAHEEKVEQTVLFNVHGVNERIRFLGGQKKRGQAGGEASAKSRRDKVVKCRTKRSPNATANAEQTVAHSGSDGQAYSPSLTPTPTLPPAPSPSVKNPPPHNRKIWSNKDGELPLPFDSAGFIEAWELWCQHRRERKPALTYHAVKGQFAELSSWGEVRAIAAIRHSVTKSYQGIYEPKTGSNGKPELRQQMIDNGTAFIEATGGAGVQHPGSKHV